MTVQSFGSLSLMSASAGGVSFPAAAATLPNVTVLPDPLCEITPLATVSSAAGTFNSSAAADTSIMRAAAPPLRTIWLDERMPWLPAVKKSPHTRLRFTFSPGVGNS